MAAPAFGTAGTYLAGASAASAAVPVPASVAAGDVILVHLYRETTAAITPPAGFTQVTNSPIATTGNVSQQSVWWKRATGADSGTYTFTWTGAAWVEGVATRYTGCLSSGDPTEVNNFAQASTATATSPSVSGTTTDVDRLLVWGGTNFDGGGQISTAPTGVTARAGAWQTLSATGTLAVGSKTQTAAGATGTLNGTWNVSSQLTASLIALLPDTGGGGGATGETRRPPLFAPSFRAPGGQLLPPPRQAGTFVPNTIPDAGVATGTGAANAAAANVAVNAGVATGTGAAYGATASSPSIPSTNLVAWYKADAITGLSDGASLDAWPDSSGNGNTTDQPFSLKPTYETGEINSLPVGRFGVGGDSALHSPADGPSTGCTIFAVVRPTTVSPGPYTIWGGDNGSLRVRINSGKVDIVKAGTAILATGATTLSTNTAYVIAATFTASTDATIYLNSAQDGTGTHSQTLSASNDTYIGATGTFGGEAFLGDIGEVVYYSAVLNSTDRGTVTTYLLNKWGISASGGSSASAGNAAGTGAAYNATVAVAPVAGNATGTGAAQAAAPNVAPTAGNAAGTGAAQSATAAVAAAAALASGTGSALDASVPGAGPTIDPNQARPATAPMFWAPPLASVQLRGDTQPAAAGATSVNAGLAAGTGAALAPAVAVSATAGSAAGTGTAQSATAAVAVNAGLAAGTGTASDATAQTSGNQNVNAGLASGTGTASGAAVVVAPAASAATGTGAAGSATPNVAPTAGNAAGTGTAQTPAPSIAVNAGAATGTGTAYNPSVSVPGNTSVNASLASGTGTAGDATPSIAPNAGRATGTGQAFNAAAVVGTAATAGLAAGTGTAGDPAASVKVNAGLATGTGTAYGAAPNVGPAAALAAGTGTAGAPVTKIWVGSGLATGTGTAYPAIAQGPNDALVHAGLATGTGQAFNAAIPPHLTLPLRAGTIVDNRPGYRAGTIVDNRPHYRTGDPHG